MTKPPVVYTAGLLRATGSGIDTDGWAWLNGLAGQQLFYPPNVSGWNDERWLDTATYLARWQIAGRVLRPLVLDTKHGQGAARRRQARRRGRSRSGATPP